MGWIDRFHSHRLAANLLMVMMLALGLFAARQVPTALDPSATIPGVWVEVQWPGAAAEDVAEAVATPLEQALLGVPGLDEIHARSRPGQAVLSLEFFPDTDMVLALDTVKQRVASLRELPRDAERPTVSRITDDELIASLLITGGDRLEDLIPLARRLEAELLEAGIDQVVMNGLPEQALNIEVPSTFLTAQGLSLERLALTLTEQAREQPAGRLGTDGTRRALRGLDQTRGPGAYEALTLRLEDTLLPLGEWATVRLEPKEDQITVRRQGAPAIELELLRKGQADVITSGRMLRRFLERQEGTLPAGVQLFVMSEVWALLAEQLAIISENAFGGTVLVLAVLLLFLAPRSAGWIAAGIPVSFALALAIYWGIFGGTVNLVALIAFVMAIGIVVDDAIIVGENAVDRFQKGASAQAAGREAARAMALPLLTASLTTLAAFAPLLLFAGPLGEIILTLPKVLLCVIIASLLECFFILPRHLSSSLEADHQRPPGRLRRACQGALEAFRTRALTPALEVTLRRPGTTVFAAVLAFALALALVATGHLRVNLVTGIDLPSVEANLRYAPSATPAQRLAALDQLEDALADTAVELGPENIKGWLSRERYAVIDDRRERGDRYAGIVAEFAGERARTISPEQFANAWRERAGHPPGVEHLAIRAEGGAGGGRADLTFRLMGEDQSALKAGALALTEALRAYDGVVHVSDDLPWGQEQWIYQLTPEGRSAGLTPEALGRQLRAAYAGARVHLYHAGREELEVRVRLSAEDRQALQSLRAYPVRLPSGDLVPLEAVATLEPRRGLDEIRHAGGVLAVRVNAWVDREITTSLAVQKAVEASALPEIKQRFDLRSELAGKSEDDALFLETLSLGAFLAVGFIYLVLVWLFACWSQPLAILAAIPFGLTGALVGHWALGIDFGLMSILAFFALAGVVVNDAIVLLSVYKDQLPKAGTASLEAHAEALRHAAQARLRAILLTTLTTVAGLAPLMFEPSSIGAVFFAPIAVTLCFGLTFATLLVLLVVPAFVLVLARLRLRLHGLRHAAQLRFSQAKEPTL